MKWGVTVTTTKDGIVEDSDYVHGEIKARFLMLLLKILKEV